MSSGEGSPPGLPLLPLLADTSSPANEEDENGPRSSGGRVANKVCRVCGDRALGYNFNVVTCESCKAFFRRNAMLNKNFRCPFSDNCEVNVVSRRMCQKCRLNKCFEVGMKKEWILSEEAKRRKRPLRKASPDDSVPDKKPALDSTPVPSPASTTLKREASSQPPEEAAPSTPSDSVRVPKALLLRLMECHGKASGKTACTCSCTCGFYPSGTKLGPPNLDDSSAAATAGTSGSEEANGWMMPADLAGVVPAGMGLEDLGGVYQSMIDATISSEMGAAAASAGVPASPATPKQAGTGAEDVLSPREQKRLDELVEANEEVFTPAPKSVLPKASLTLTDLVNMTDIAVRRIIQMSKKISGFRSLCQEDQIALLKGSCTEMMILRGLMTYDADADVWKGPQAISCHVLKGVAGGDGGDAYVQHKRWLSSFHPDWRTNEPLMLLIGMVILFNPSRPHVTHPDFVQQQQNLYYSLLSKYLRTIMPASEAEGAYRELCDRILALHSLNETLQKIFLDVNPKDVEPLLIEIFDLK